MKKKQSDNVEFNFIINYYTNDIDILTILSD
jgi:hypothetical protein